MGKTTETCQREVQRNQAYLGKRPSSTVLHWARGLRYPPFGSVLCMTHRPLLEFKGSGTMWITRAQVVEAPWIFGHKLIRPGYAKSTKQAVTPVMSPQFPPVHANSRQFPRFPSLFRAPLITETLRAETCRRALRDRPVKFSVLELARVRLRGTGPRSIDQAHSPRLLRIRHAACCHRHVGAARSVASAALAARGEALGGEGRACRTGSKPRFEALVSDSSYCSSKFQPIASWMHVAAIGE